MRFLASILFVLSAVTLCVSQEKSAINPASDAPDAKFISAAARNLNADRDHPEREAEFTIRVKNVGAKIITAVEWEATMDEYLGNTMMKKYHFRCEDKGIKPGETKKLTGYMEDMIARYHSTAAVRLVKVEFSDGSKWVREETK